MRPDTGIDEIFFKKFSTDQYQKLISSGHLPGAYLFQIAKHLDQRFVSYRSTTKSDEAEYHHLTSGDLKNRSRSTKIKRVQVHVRVNHNERCEIPATNTLGHRVFTKV